MKTIEFENYFNDNGKRIYATKGHHDPVLFLEELKRNFDKEFEPEEIEHVYLRAVPGGENDDEFAGGFRLYEAQKSKGAFAVTRVKLSI